MKNHLRGVKYIALAMIYLVLSIVFISANTLAAFSFSISGSNGVNGYRAAEDSADINTISSYNVSVIDSDGVETEMFCNNNTPINCSYPIPWASTDNNEFLFTLRHQSTPSTDYYARLTVDRLAPNISFTVTRINTGIKINYTIKDYAYSTVYGNCSGLDKLEYDADGVESGTIMLNTTQNTCLREGSFSLAVPSGYYPDYRIALTANDNVGNSNTVENISALDFQAPNIQENFDIQSSGHPIDTLSTNAEANLDIIVSVEDVNLDTNRVYGDLRKLTTNSIYYSSYKNKTATCSPETDDNITYKCMFPNVMVRPISDTLTINITAFDKDNNYATKGLSKTITLLNDPGQPIFIGPDKSQCTTDLTTCYAHTGTNTFYLELAAGSNYTQNRIKYGINSAVAPFTLCSYKEDKWVCFTPYSVSGTQTLHLFVAANSYDDYGNTVPLIQRNVYVDDEKPEIISSITSSHSSCAVSGDTMQLTLRAREANSPELKIYVNTTDFTDKEIQQGTCVKDINDEWDCTIDITGFVTATEPYDRDIVIADLAGNKDTASYKFEVCASDSTATPNIITKITPQTMPKIDRKTASLISVKTFIPLVITKKPGLIISMNVENCIGQDDSEMDIMGTGHYITGNNLVLYIGTEGAQLPNTLEINCTLSARIRSGNSMFQKPEYENVTINIDTYNNPLGTVDAVVTKNIDAQKQRLRDLDSSIETYKGWDKFLGKLCDFADIINNIDTLLQGFKAVFYVVCMALSWLGLGEGLWTSVSGWMSAFDGIVQTYVWPSGGNLLLNPIGFAVKYSCFIYTCKFYKASGLMTLYYDVDGISTALATQKAREDEINKVKESQEAMDKTVDEWKNKDKNELSKLNAEETELRKQLEDMANNPNYYNSFYSPEQLETRKTELSNRLKEINSQQNTLGRIYEINNLPIPMGTNLVSSEEFTIGTNKYKFEDGNLLKDGKFYGYVDIRGNIITADGHNLIDGTVNYDFNGNIISISPEFDGNKLPVGKNENIKITKNTQNTNTQNTNSQNTNTPDTNQNPPRVSTNLNNPYANELSRYNSRGENIKKETGYFVVTMGNIRYEILSLTKIETDFADTIQYVDLKNKKTDCVKNLAGCSILDISGNSIVDPLDDPNLGEYTDDYSKKNALLYKGIGTLQDPDWIINPYRSVHYDFACAPAILYNLEKEKQITCMYLSCLQNHSAAGMSTLGCTKRYGLDMCLYVEGAESELNQWNVVIQGLLRSGIAWFTGEIVQGLFNELVCETYSINYNAGIIKKPPTLADGAYEVGCGLLNVGMRWKQLSAVFEPGGWKGITEGNRPADPAETKDYCVGVDYK
jgi:hypothetical protein